MFVGVYKDKVNNCEHYIYLDNLSYYGISIKNSNVFSLDKDIIDYIYNQFKMSDSSMYIKNYRDYQVYYDNTNKTIHYLKDGVEDILMFLLRNSKSAILNTNNNKHYSKHDAYRRISTLTFTFVGSITMLYSIMATNISEIKAIDNFKQEINYIEYVPTNNELEIVTVDDAVSMINNSDGITERDKKYLSNRNLLENVLSTYEGTNMEYVIKTRLNNLNIVYNQFNDDSKGKYKDSNFIYLSNTLDSDKNYDEYSHVLGHEFVHLLQADIPIYLKESSAEIISSEYFNHSCDVYNDACTNFRLLVETLGPKIMWDYVFSGDNTSFNKILKDNLDYNDYNKLINEFELNPFDEQPNHELITSLIHRLYKNMYAEEIKNNHDIYDFDGNYIEKKCFTPNKYDYSKIIYCNKDKALEDNIAQYVTTYNYQMNIDSLEYYNYIKENKKDKIYYDNGESVGVMMVSDNSKASYTKVDNQEKIIISDDNKIIEYDFTKENILMLSKKYRFIYFENKLNNNISNNMELVGNSKVLRCINNKYKCIGNEIAYYVSNIQDRFPEQSMSLNKHYSN